ncbi:MAG: efflux RND transporter periplasmic adaptor subunit [Chitinophagales bacterium]
MKNLRWLFIVIAVAALVGGGFWYAGQKKAAEVKAEAQQAFDRVPVTRRDLSLSISASGTVKLSGQVNVRPEVSGTVKAIRVKVGDHVTKGQVLLVLDDSELRDKLAQAKEAVVAAEARLAKAKSDEKVAPSQLQAQVESARAAVVAAELKLKQLKEGAKPEEVDQQKAAVNQARINRDSAEADYKRFKDLYTAGVISKQQYEQTEAKYLTAEEALRSAQRRLDQLLAPPDPDDVRSAEAGLSQAKANLALALANQAAGSGTDQVASAQSQLVQAQVAYKQAQDNLRAATVVAPVSGVVVDASLLATSKNNQNSAQPLGVGDAIAPESGVISISDPTAVEVHASVDETDVAKVSLGQLALITADAFEGTTFRGRVTQIAPAGTTSEGVVTFDVTIAVTGHPELKAGMTAEVELILARKPGVLAVPTEAIVQRRGRPMVQVAETGDRRFKRVETGLSDDTYTEIVSGLAEGETVLVAKPKPAAESSGRNAGMPRRGMVFGMGGPRR